MPASTEPNFDIKHSWAVGESYKPEMDANLKKFGGLFFPSVINATITALPGSPTEGDRYIFAADAGGGNANKVAVFANTAWITYTPKRGWLFHDQSVAIGTIGCFRFFDGTNWVNADFGLAANVITNSHIAAAAAIALSKLATITANRVAVSGAGGVIEAATATKDQVNALAGRIAGRVGFFDGSGLLTDSANFQWDNTNQRLGLSRVPSFKFDAQLNSDDRFRLVQTVESNFGFALTKSVSAGAFNIGWLFYVPNNGKGLRFYNDSGVGDIFEIQDSGIFNIGERVGATAAQFAVGCTSASRVVAQLKGAASQTANICEELDSSHNILSGRNAKGKELLDGTLTAGGTTGAQTINKPSGSVNFAAAATSLVVTCDQCTTSSIVQAFVLTNDTTMKSAVAVPASGSFTIYPNAAPTAETKVGFIITEIV